MDYAHRPSIKSSFVSCFGSSYAVGWYCSSCTGWKVIASFLTRCLQGIPHLCVVTSPLPVDGRGNPRARRWAAAPRPSLLLGRRIFASVFHVTSRSFALPAKWDHFQFCTMASSDRHVRNNRIRDFSIYLLILTYFKVFFFKYYWSTIYTPW